ncbi:1-acyl-sn-glycerol-3-phosphate acyltransferase [Ornithinimicrobium sp. LYQ103]|uniref:1-acyl-sn-glycerol-3-phosphate acyltransferase n=1 Tax=Ornithinimicrobium sp. LYQ103 TaxID=3378796 RepID=UPI0038549C50
MTERMPVRRAAARAALRLARWRTVGEVPRSGIIVGAPHTSNWDWVAMLVLLWSHEVRPRVLVKQELFRGPLGWLLRSTGGVPVDRVAPGSVVQQLSDQARGDESFLIVLAAEGTRSKGSHWKSGFYRLARQTGLPLSLGFIDGPSRTLGFGPTVRLTGDVRSDMDVVRTFYADKRGVHPELRTEPRLREEEGPAQARAEDAAG